MKNKWEAGLVIVFLLLSFLVPFFMTTWATDWVCYHNGFYAEGFQDDKAAFGGN